MRKVLIVGAALLAGTSMALAQAGSNIQTRENNEQNIGTVPHKDDAMKSRAQGQLPSGTAAQGQRGPQGKVEPPGGLTQDQRQNEEIGKPPNGK